MNRLKIALSALASLAGWMLFAVDQAAEVHVVQQAKYGATVEQLDVSECYTGADYQTVTAPVYGGYIFTHWSSSATEGLTVRDVFGRSYDAAKFRLYDNVTLTANYVDAALDDDHDGVADGHELYWYGNLDQDAESDTDGDGMTFAEELQFGTNPLMPENGFAGVVTGSSVECQYNAGDYPRYVIRSQPEGGLFATISGFAKPGTMIVTPTCNRLTSFFCRWETDGQSVRDGFGRAVDSVRFAMPDQDVEYVAVVEENDVDREKLYWYGTTSVSLDSDTDGDGLTLAAEIAAGTNPLMPESGYSGVVTADSENWVYNPSNYRHYVVRSEPEGELFETVSGYKKPGETLTTPTCDRLTSFFGYWTVNGERQADTFGRAKDQLSFPMPDEDIEAVARTVDDDVERDQYYWYGRLQDLDSDTDGDGLTLAEEIAAGTNPLMAEFGYSGVVTADGEDIEMNLQPYEQVGGFVVDDKFLVPELAGRAIWPVVADVNGDGLWDIVVCYEGGTRVFVNVGGKGSPEFEEQSGDTTLSPGVDLTMNSTEKLTAMALDVEPVGALSATVWGDETLLVSDGEGRIWYYRGIADGSSSTSGETPLPLFELQHKVWGGSFAGFAEGLRIAAVDWDDDGDLDCLCGTADGKLMLLRDPRVGRPTNVKARVGVDSVLLVWDPNAQSRIRGYNVYRSMAETDEFGRIVNELPIPRYRDQPEIVQDYDYKVTSVSRFYTAGNSTPIVSESTPTEAVRASMGKVAFRWGDAAGFVGEEVAVGLAVENSLNLSGAGLALKIGYDVTVLTPLRVETSGLTEGVAFTQSAEDGVWTICATDGEVAAGAGTVFTLIFTGAKATENTEVSLTEVTVKSAGGKTVAAILPSSNARVELAVRTPEEPIEDPTVVTPYGRGDVDGNGRLEKADLQLLARLMNGGPTDKWNEKQLRAGDYNENGELDNDDYQLMRADFRAKGIVNGGEKMGVL